MACLVTAETDNPNDTVARCGPYSIFALMKQACPAIVRDAASGPRDGLSEVELNKALQVCLPQFLRHTKLTSFIIMNIKGRLPASG